MRRREFLKGNAFKENQILLKENAFKEKTVSLKGKIFKKKQLFLRGLTIGKISGRGAECSLRSVFAIQAERERS